MDPAVALSVFDTSVIFGSLLSVLLLFVINNHGFPIKTPHDYTSKLDMLCNAFSLTFSLKTLSIARPPKLVRTGMKRRATTTDLQSRRGKRNRVNDGEETDDMLGIRGRDDAPAKASQSPMTAEKEKKVSYLSSSPPFNLLEVILSEADIAIEVVRWIPPKTLLHLYSISKTFHSVMSRTYMSFIKANATIYAPYGHVVFPFQSFRQLCIEDPVSRAMDHRQHQAVRHIPGIKWLLMASFRHNTTEKILRALDAAGHRLPMYATVAVQKVWFTMSFPSNAARIALLHNQGYWHKIDLYAATQFFIKVDMRMTDPTHGRGETVLRDIFLGHKNLVPLLKLITHELNIVQVLQYYVLYCYQPPTNRFIHQTLFGVSPNHVGRGKLEAWGQGTQLALRVDECVMRECIRRGIVMSKWYLDMITYGYQRETNNTPIDGIPGRPRIFRRTANLPEDGEEFSGEFYTEVEQALPGINQAFRRLRL
jgi:hypothetical protein